MVCVTARFCVSISQCFIAVFREKGYFYPIPNFFISARNTNKRSGGAKFLPFEDKELKSQERGILQNRQFKNRLFDNDTLLLCHYDVIFIYRIPIWQG